MNHIYLAGPITGLSYDSATDWRNAAVAYLAQHQVEGRSPMRGKDWLKGIQELAADGYEEEPISAPAGIVGRDRFDVRTSAAVLMNLVGATRISVGSMVELGWADAWRKPVIMIMEPDNVHRHGFVAQLATYTTPFLQAGLQMALMLVGVNPQKEEIYERQ